VSTFLAGSRRPWGVLLVAAALLSVLSACSGDAEEPAERGGKSALPDTTPAATAYVTPAADVPAAPDFDLTLVDDTPVKASALWKYRPAVLVFFASWCDVCAQRQAELNALAEKYDDQVVFLGVAAEDTAADLGAYLDEQKVPYPVGLDEAKDTWRKYAITEPPGLVLVSKDGKLLRGWPGGIETAELDTQIQELVLAK
jgi:thiol-disulfide isomerase/thioredoxin